MDFVTPVGRTTGRIVEDVLVSVNFAVILMIHMPFFTNRLFARNYVICKLLSVALYSRHVLSISRC